MHITYFILNLSRHVETQQERIIVFIRPIQKSL